MSRRKLPTNGHTATLAPPVAPDRRHAGPGRPLAEPVYVEAPLLPDPGDGAPASPPPKSPPFLFECGWEVCWQLGGIYTVLKTKAPQMIKKWGERYALIGPYNPATAAQEFEEQPAPDWIEKAFDELRYQGMACHFGRWLIPGRPYTILLDFRGRYGKLHEDKYLLFADHGIGTQAGDGEVNDVVAFGFTVALFLKTLQRLSPTVSLLAHFHEWMGGVAVPRLRHEQVPIGLTFTTHATLLGRYLAGGNAQFYDHLPFFDPDKEAARFNILPRHLIEKAAAHASHVFTTVSSVTGAEATQLLGREPDLILPNGIDIHRFEAPHEVQHLHVQAKEQIHQFVMGHFFPSYTMDLDNTLYFFTAGRYEYTNKGIDLYLEALHRLNERLKREGPSAPTVVAFVVARAAVRGINAGVLQSQAQLDALYAYCDRAKEDIGRRLFFASASGRSVVRGELIDESVQINLKRLVAAFKRYGQPTVVTHDLVDDATDPVLKHIRHRGMFNHASDPVKIVFHPQFVTQTSPLLSMDYDQFVRGCHLGVFPSYYEPWGYTPMECIASGVPSVTSDLAGFGAYVQQNMKPDQHPGLHVLRRRGLSFGASADALADALFAFTRLTRRERIDQRNRVEAVAEKFDWVHLTAHYHDAHDLALARIGQKQGSVQIRLA